MEKMKAKNIYIIGPQSTGKTTLVNALERLWKQHEGQKTTAGMDSSRLATQMATLSLNHNRDTSEMVVADKLRECVGGREVQEPVIIREVARTVLQKLNITRADLPARAEGPPTNRPTSIDIQRHILQTQSEIEASLDDTRPGTWFISDRSGIDSLVYAWIFAGEESVQQLLALEQWPRLAARLKEGVVFLCEAGGSWLVDDDVRHLPADMDDWMDTDAKFRKVLKARGIEYNIIPSSLESLQDRVDLVIQAWYNACV